MSCIDCPPVHREPPVQYAERFKAWYIGGAVYEGTSKDWAKLPDDGVLAVKVYFNDGTSRNCNGNDWYGLLIIDADTWTIIHNNNADNEKRYPTAIWKRGQWTSEAEMNAVVEAMSVD